MSRSTLKPLRIHELTAPHSAIINTLLHATLENYALAFEARLVRLRSTGELIDLGPDYLTRIAAIRSLIALCVRGRTPLTPDKTVEFKVTLDLIKRFLDQPERPPEQEKPPAAIEEPEPEEEPNARLTILSLVNRYKKPIQALFAAGLASLQHAPQARKIGLRRNGQLVDLGPDLRVRKQLISLATEFCTAGRAPLSNPEVQLTWEEQEQKLIDYLESLPDTEDADRAHEDCA